MIFEIKFQNIPHIFYNGQVRLFDRKGGRCFKNIIVLKLKKISALSEKKLKRVGWSKA